MLEAEFQSQVRQLCKIRGLLVYHTQDSRRSDPGFPDLVIVGSRRMIYRELKKQDGRVSAMQQYWIDRLTDLGQDAGVWRPSDMPRIVQELGTLGAITIPAPTDVAAAQLKAAGGKRRGSRA